MAKRPNLVQMVRNHWLANNAVMFLVTEEPYRCMKDIRTAVEQLKAERDEDIDVVGHDKVCGFHGSGDPTLTVPKDKSNNLSVAIPMMMATGEEMKAANADSEPPFDAARDIVCVMKDPNWELCDSPGKSTVIQRFRTVIQTNMCSRNYHGFDGDEGDASDWPAENKRRYRRGKRMIILVSSTEKLPEDLPEIDPIVVPLPDPELLRHAVRDVLVPLEGKPIAGTSKKIGKLTKESEDKIVGALAGFTYQRAEDVLSLAVVANKGYEDINAFIGTIEIKKAQMLQGYAGLTYVPKDSIKLDNIPGYEEVVEFVKHRLSLSTEKATKHRIKKLVGMLLVGLPGGGKSLFAKYLGRLFNKDILFLSLGDCKGSLMGQSQANLRRALTVGHAIGCIMIVDDTDKGSMAAQGGPVGDSGTSGEMIQMLLTDMDGGVDNDEDGLIFVFTANRVQQIPPELIRAGRMDAKWFVPRPDEETRLNIMKVHLAMHNILADNEGVLKTIATAHTKDWVGAELADLVNEAVVVAVATNAPTVDTDWMTKRASETTPMAKLDAYRDDFAAMEKAANQFRTVGKCKPAAPAQGRTRTGKSVTI